VAAKPCTVPALTPGLPATADGMLAWLYERGSDGTGLYDEHGNRVGPAVPRDTRAWNAVFELLNGYLPPQSQAALFQALAKLPGSRLVPTTTDAADRPMTGVARMVDSFVYVILFDPRTGAYAGVQTRNTTNSHLGRAGEVFASDAILEEAVVGRPGQLP